MYSDVISIIHPSRMRPQQAFETATRWIERAGCPVEYILSIDEDDPCKSEYLSHHHRIQRFITKVDANKTAVQAINSGAKEAKGDVFIVISDDFDCPKNWGLQIRILTHERTDWIMKTPDGIQDWLITLPIMDRQYYNRFLYIYHPDYKHGFCDTEMTCVGELTGRLMLCDIPFSHKHYSVTGQKPDEVAIRADSYFEQGRATFIARKKNNFYLTEIKGQMTDNVYSRMQ